MKLEHDLSTFLGCSDLLLTRSGSDAILCALLSEDIGPGDEVLMPVSICQKVVNVVLLLGALPMLCDCDEQLTLDLVDAANRVSDRTRAIIVHHPHGYPQEMGEFQQFARANSLLFIEDCAQAAGGFVAGHSVGGQGDIAVFSFGTGKTTPVGFGGCIVAGCENRMEKLKLIARCGSAGHPDHMVLGVDSDLSEVERKTFQQRMNLFPDLLFERRRKSALMMKCLSDRFDVLGLDGDGRNQWCQTGVSSRYHKVER